MLLSNPLDVVDGSLGLGSGEQGGRGSRIPYSVCLELVGIVGCVKERTG